MNRKLANRVREILDQQNMPHNLHKLGDDRYAIHWIKLCEGPNVEVEDFGTIDATTRIADIPIGDFI